MHCRIDQAGVIVVTLHIPRAIKPIDAQRFNSLLGVVVDVDEFHNSAEIIGLAGRLAHKVHLIWTPN